MYIAAIACVLLLQQPYPVLHDYPEWMYQGFVAHELISGNTSELTALFEWVPVAVPNAITQLALGALNFIVSPVLAGQIWLGVYLLLAAIVGQLLVKTQRLSGVMQFLFTVTIVFGPGFWNGYINFQFGLLFFALFVVNDLRRSLVWVFVFSILIYFSHASVFAGFICYVVLAEKLYERRTGITVALLPGLGLLLWYTIFKLLAGGEQNVALGSVSQWLQYKLYTLAKQGPFHNFIRHDGESLLATVNNVYQAGFIVNFLVAGLIGLWILWVFWRSYGARPVTAEYDVLHKSGVLNKGVLVGVSVLLLAWLIAGKNSFGVVNLGERFLIVALMLLILCADCPVWLRRAWLAMGVLASGLTIGSLIVISQDAQSRYAVDRSADSTELSSFVDEIYKNSRHKYFNHRLFIYANLGQYLVDPEPFKTPPLVDHESSIIRIKKTAKSNVESQ